MFSRKKIAVLVAEALGTAVLTFSVLAVSRSAIGISYFVALAVGLVVALLTAVFSASSQAQFNPAITVGMWTVRKTSTLDAVLNIAAQFVGALAAFRLYQYFTLQPLQSIADVKFDWHIAVAELVGAGVFALGFAAAVYQKFEGGKKAAVVGGSLGLGVLVAGVASNALLNPAVAMGVQSWSYTYVLAPVVGAIVGFNLYALLFAGEKLALVPAKAAKPASSKPATVRKTAAKKRAKK